MGKTTNGTQSIRRALEMLRVISEHNNQGLSLQKLTTITGLGRSTAHRLVSCLVEEGFAMRESMTKRYHVGLESLQIGLSAISETSVTDSLKPLIMRLARIAGDTVFLVIRQGDYALCIVREHGDYPIRIFTIDEGEKRLMGIGAGGLALLSMMDDQAISELYKRHEEELEKNGYHLDSLLNKVHQCRIKGYSEMESKITPGISGVGYAFQLSRITHVAISFGAVNSRLNSKRREQLGNLLKNECTEWVEDAYKKLS